MQFEDLAHLEQWTPLAVEWVDTATETENGWHAWDGTHLEIDGLLTVGALGRVDERAISLVLGRDTTTEHVYGVMTIPLFAVVAVHELVRRESVATRRRLPKVRHGN